MSVVVLGAGSGQRVGAGRNKVLLELSGRPLLAWSVRTALRVPGIVRIVVVAAPGEEQEVAQALGPELEAADTLDVEVLLTAGGDTRHESEWRALQAIADRLDPQTDDGGDRPHVVAVHDGARPLATVDLYTAVVGAAREHGGALPATPLPGVLRRDLSAAPVGLAGVQTPQAFRAGPLLAAYRAAAREGEQGTDTASTFRRHAGLPVVAVASTPGNLKVTWPEDVALAERLLSRVTAD
ncbi:2-C-methyl-D-erythritol 4-phosphate cytidylyltransferase [Nocardioides sp. CBS4Y-1]|uniref:2-C-methyl-D-erythritol 4-phosphate cytidylyltransferase n=1 Tax=Nocardioides acrostichi TaxID=2784339 RepID=A0A930YCH8_9ACTN|nr:2-C-methyl-D-erythritol 4-phosphate cytidylyltransferase [Nocardioides acrostichi]